MLRSIPWDVWIAAVLAAVMAAIIFESVPAIFVVLYVALCAYIVVETFNNRLS